MSITAEEREKQLIEEYAKEREAERLNAEKRYQARVDIILPKTQLLFKNHSKIGIALKRFIKKNLVSRSFIREDAIFLLRVQSKKNGKRFNATIEYDISAYHPYSLHVDRRVPWSIMHHQMSGQWTQLKKMMSKDYDVIEIYPF